MKELIIFSLLTLSTIGLVGLIVYIGSIPRLYQRTTMFPYMNLELQREEWLDKEQG